jgi:hypothetical protein
MPRHHAASAIRVLTGTLAGLSWLLISNHCAIVSAAEEAKPPEHGCPMHASAPVQRPVPAKQFGDQLCCKNLHATAAKLSLARIFPLNTPFVAVFSKPAPFETRVGQTFSPLCLDTGPPEFRSFSELILQRSLLAHAPPFLA